MSSSLDEYLVQFHSGHFQPRPPVRPPSRRSWRDTKGKARIYHLLQNSLPPSTFDFAVGRYHALRELAGRNPGRGHLLPDFLVIGAAKCGTTSLFDWICEHPLIARPTSDGQLRKEILFFDYKFRLGEDWYRTHFPLQAARGEFEREHGRPFLTGEATASYLTGYWVAGRVARLLPDVKLIVTLRNPVDRAYSAFHMSRRERLEECESFESAIALEADRLAPDNARTRADPDYNPPLPPPLGYWSYLQRSRYADHVERWLEVLPRDRFLFLKFEDLAAEPQRTLEQVYDFLGLPVHRHSTFRKLNAGSYAPIRAETHAHLVDYFRPYNERLRELTGIDFGWDSE